MRDETGRGVGELVKGYVALSGRGYNQRQMETILSNLSYDLHDVEVFVTFLQDSEEYGRYLEFHAGLFGGYTTQAIRRVIGENDRVRLSFTKVMPSSLGNGLERGTIDVSGDVHNELGYKMKGGKIILNGNSVFGAGIRMTGGTIEVNGYGGDAVGSEMKGGEINVNGDVGMSLGSRMRGGSIRVRGNARESVGFRMSGGDIFVQGDCGYNLGSEMSGGKIHIVGDAKLGSVGALMSDGEIEVGGDVGLTTGVGMRGGTIKIHGDAKDLGFLSDGGRIEVDGKYSLSHSGAEIWRKGKRLQ
jgi:formylmethanofuran dehydrogenase subunit C